MTTQQMGETQHTFVIYRGELVKVSLKEFRIMALRGHLLPNYKEAPIVLGDPCLTLRR